MRRRAALTISAERISQELNVLDVSGRVGVELDTERFERRDLVAGGRVCSAHDELKCCKGY